ncbi:MAG: peroxiredoxin-like family protein [Thermodesulfobacteriota bacterium]
MELEALEEARFRFDNLGASLMIISPMTEDQTREYKQEKGFSLDLLSDPGNQVAEAYGLAYTVPEDLKGVYLDMGIDLGEYNGDDTWRLPMPARYIIDRDRVIRYARINPDHTQRPEPIETVKALEKIIE